MATPRLRSYREKRDFSRTSEPAGVAPANGGNRFVVHKHHATSDHYDLDNLSSHQRASVREMIEAKGARLNV